MKLKLIFKVSPSHQEKDVLDLEEPALTSASSYPSCCAQGDIMRRLRHDLYTCLEEPTRAFHAEGYEQCNLKKKSKNGPH